MIGWIRTLFNGGQVGQRAARPPGEIQGSNIKSKLDLLAKTAWGTREEIAKLPDFVLPANALNKMGNEEVVRHLMRHGRLIAPRLPVPWMMPRLVVKLLTNAAGLFSIKDEWIDVVVGADFFEDIRAARAILCHELCHYILNASNIREESTEENERLTDAAMFVFGFGEVFLAGYRRPATDRYRPGHKLGYLSDLEYRYADRYTRWLRNAAHQFISSESELEVILRSVVFDEKARARLKQWYRSKYPHKTPAELIRSILDDIEKENR